MAERKVIDWEALEIDYRAGVLSTRELGAMYGVSHTLIARKAKAAEWDRDLSAKIKAKAAAIVSKLGVSSGVSVETENERISANASLVATVELSQRSDIQRSRKLVMSLLAELEAQTDGTDLLQQLREVIAGEVSGSHMALFNKVIGLGSRSGTMKSLADSLRTLVSLEREAFGISGKPAPTGYEETLQDLGA